jgi:hypothetical protein
MQPDLATVMPFISTAVRMDKLDTAMLGASEYERAARDFYPTIDENVTRALCRTILGVGLAQKKDIIWECACGDWSMAKVLEEFFTTVMGSDLVPQHPKGFEADFLNSTPKQGFMGIITNPPFGKLVAAFMARGVEQLRRGNGNYVAMLGRNELDSASGKGNLFGNCPEYYGKVVLTWRPRWIKGSTGSPRHNYAWFIWADAEIVKANGGPRIFYAGKR